MALVCHCFVKYERDVNAAIEAGAETISEVAELCGAGADCGGCAPYIAELLTKAGHPTEAPVPSCT